MNIYWSLRNVPELAPLAPADRKRVHEACLRRYFWQAPATRRSLCAYLMLILCPGAFIGLTIWLVQAFGGTTPIWLIVSITIVGAELCHFVFSRVAIAHLRQFYSDYIQKELRHDMKAHMGSPKYRFVVGSFLLLFGVFSYLKYSQLALLAMACFMASLLIGMIAERREHEAKTREQKIDGYAKRSA